MDIYIKKAIEEAKKAYKLGEIPVGAIIIKDEKIIAKAHNQKEKMNNSLAHAELLAITKASKKLNNWRLDDCIMIVTLQPCPMCSSAIKQSRIGKLIYLKENDNKIIVNICEKILKIVDNNKKIIVEKVYSNEYELLWKKFFKTLRK